MTVRGFLSWRNYSSDGTQQFFLEDNQPYQIGRHESCDICLMDEYVSNFHATIKYDSHDGLFYLTDCSKNGTILNDSWMLRDRPTSLLDRTHFKIADTEFRFNAIASPPVESVDPYKTDPSMLKWPVIQLTPEGVKRPLRKDYLQSLALLLAHGDSFNLVGAYGCGKSYLFNNDRRYIRRAIDYLPGSAASSLLVVQIDLSLETPQTFSGIFFFESILNRLSEKLSHFYPVTEHHLIKPALANIKQNIQEIKQTASPRDQVRLWLDSIRQVTEPESLGLRLALLLDNATLCLKELPTETLIQLGKQLVEAEEGNRLNGLSLGFITHQPAWLLLDQRNFTPYEKHCLQPFYTYLKKIYWVGPLDHVGAVLLAKRALQEASKDLCRSKVDTEHLQLVQEELAVLDEQNRPYYLNKSLTDRISEVLAQLCGCHPSLIKQSAAPFLCLIQGHFKNVEGLLQKKEPLVACLIKDNLVSQTCLEWWHNLAVEEQDFLKELISKPAQVQLCHTQDGSVEVDLDATETQNNLHKLRSYLQHGLIDSFEGSLGCFSPVIGHYLTKQVFANWPVIQPISDIKPTVLMGRGEPDQNTKKLLENLAHTTRQEDWRIQMRASHFQVVVIGYDKNGRAVGVSVELPNMLWQFFNILAGNTNTTHRYDQLAVALYNEDNPYNRESVNRLATRLRDLVEPRQLGAGRSKWIFIHSRRGIGYYMDQFRLIS